VDSKCFLCCVPSGMRGETRALVSSSGSDIGFVLKCLTNLHLEFLEILAKHQVRLSELIYFVTPTRGGKTGGKAKISRGKEEGEGEEEDHLF
jgi:hypothetical protein